MESAGEMAIGIVLEAVVTAASAGLVYLIWGKIFGTPRRVMVLPFQCGLVMDGERVVRKVGPGSHWVRPKHTLIPCEMRPKPFVIRGLELTARDAATVRISVNGEYKVTDELAFLLGSSDGFGSLYLEVRQALKTAVSELPASELPGAESAIVSRVLELVIPRADQLGLEIRQLSVAEMVASGWLRQI